MMDHAAQTLMLIREAIDKGTKQVKAGELLESDVLENVSGLIDEYFNLINM